jgi:WD40 repeat protein
VCALVSQRWRVLADDPWLWKRLCTIQGWEWREPHSCRALDFTPLTEFNDEGVGDDEDDWTGTDVDSGAVSTSSNTSTPTRISYNHRRFTTLQPFPCNNNSSFRYSAPPTLPSLSLPSQPDYKRLHQTHILLSNRIRHSSYRLTYLQTRHTPNSHTSTIYCLQLYTFPDLPDCPSRQVLFTGSMDKTIRQWDLSRGTVERVLQGVHDASVLSLCARKNFIVSGGNDGRVVVWDIQTGEVVKVIEDHLDRVLCVRFDDIRLVSCSPGGF